MKLADVQKIDRVHPRIYTLYLLNAVLASVASCGIALPFLLLGFAPTFIRYRTLRYRFDEEGVGLGWGWFTRQESHITYDKIQDIHLERGFLERWLGLGTVRIQTASGSGAAEINLVGLTDYDGVRDFLYERMRGARHLDEKAGASDSLALLAEIRDEVARLRQAVARG